MEPLKTIDENTPAGTPVAVAMDNIIYLAWVSDPGFGKYTAMLRFGDGSESSHWRERVYILPSVQPLAPSPPPSPPPVRSRPRRSRRNAASPT